MSHGSTSGKEGPFAKFGQGSRGYLRAAVALFLFCAFAGQGSLVGGLFCYYLPKTYFSKCVVKVCPQDFQGARASGQNPAPGASATPLPPQVLPLDSIRSREVLLPVIQGLNLAEVWSVKEGGVTLPEGEAYNHLLGMLQLEPEADQGAIQIGVYSNDRVEAANIANMIGATCRCACRGGVNICEKALPSVQPVKPNCPVILGIGAAGGILLGLLSAGAFLFLTKERREEEAG